MSSPTPPVPIVHGCSVIVNNVLYAYSANAFQALPLTSGGTWRQLPHGVPVSGAACVKGTINGTASNQALWVVGGAYNASHPHYPGLQRYSFSTQKWETITPVVKVTQNRQNHAAVFINSTASILVYAGSQDSVDVPSSQTFLISTIPPYSVSAYTAKNYPALSPILLPWSNNSAITLGGDNNVQAIYHFEPANGWQDLGTSLTFGLNSSYPEQGLLVHGSDDSKVLELYNLNTSPNVVSRVVLQDANGKLAPPGQMVGAETASKKRKRQTLNDWPAYNATYAPTTTRTGYTLAQAPNGLVAITGGDAQHPVELFNQRTNAWVDTSNFFGSSAATTSSSSSTSSATSSATSSPTVAAPSNGNDHHRTSLILGATLGSILGFIALLIILLLLIRWRRRRKRLSRESSGSDEKGRLSFADRGAPFMIEAGGAINNPNNANELYDEDSSRSRSRTLTSQSSVAPLVPPSGRNGSSAKMSPVKESPNKRDANRPVVRGGAGVPSIILEADSNRNSATSTQPTNHRGSGWSGYFLGKDDRPQPRQSSNLTPRNSTYNPSTGTELLQAGTYLNYDPMRPGSQDPHDCSTHGPTHIPPPALGPTWDSGRVSKAVTGSYGTELPNRAPSSRSLGNRTVSSTRPSTEGSSTLNSTIFTSQEEPMHWTPVTRSDWNTPNKTRDTKSSSYYGDGGDSSAPGPSTTSAPKAISRSPGFGLRKSDGSLWGDPGPIVGHDEEPGISRTGNGIGMAKTTAGREAQVQESGINSDMSWLKISDL